MTAAADSVSQVAAPRLQRKRALTGALVVLVAAWALAIGVGPMSISGRDMVAAIWSLFAGIGTADVASSQARFVIFDVRMPRAIFAVLIGSSLGVAGALMQGLFRNPLAEPGLIGVSSGAAAAVAAAIVFEAALVPVGGRLIGPWLLPLVAFVGGASTAFLVYRLSTRLGRTAVAKLILVGVAINAATVSAIGFLIFASDDRQLRDITFWTLGSLSAGTWSAVTAMTVPALLALVLAPRMAPALNGLMLGERDAQYLGHEIEPVKRVALLLASLAVGAAVAFAGIVGFLGLLVPHLVRMAVGPDHKLVLPGSAIVGAIVLLLADLIARTAVAPAELPVGLVTSAIGAPFMLWLLHVRRVGGIDE